MTGRTKAGAGKAAALIALAGAAALVYGLVSIAGQTYPPANGAFPDTLGRSWISIVKRGGGCTILVPTDPPAPPLYYTLVKDSLSLGDTVDISGTSHDSADYIFDIRGYVITKQGMSGPNWVPAVSWDVPGNGVDAFTLSIDAVISRDTTVLSDSDLIGHTKAYVSLSRLPSEICTTEVFSNPRSYANAVTNLETKLINVYDDDTALMEVVCTKNGTDYFTRVRVPLKPSLYGQAMKVDSVVLYDSTRPHIGVNEIQNPSMKKPAQESSIMSNPDFAALVSEEERKGYDVEVRDALGRTIQPSDAGQVNFVRERKRGNTKWEQGYKVVILATGRRKEN